MNRKVFTITCAILLAATFGVAQAKVSPEEATKLKKELTPMGAERAGNADGTIPAWTGGMSKSAGWESGDPLIDPFADEKPLFTITKDNYQQYVDKLAPSQIAMFQSVPKFKMDVYPTHRTVKAPDWIEQNTYNNALSSELVDNGNGVSGACGGIPFPIPKSGGEAIQNHLMRYWGSSIFINNIGVAGYRNGDPVITEAEETFLQFPFYQKGKPCDDGLLQYASEYSLPVRRKGEQLILNDFLNASKRPREAWQYIPGQRRVRRAPTIGFDTPDKAITTYDDAYIYNGSPERYDWKLVGKKEIYVPYNGFTLENAWQAGQLKMDNFTNEYPDSDLIFRWELHRMWEVEGTLKAGARHIYAKRVLYLDEDSWSGLISDKYDAKGQLWRFNWGNQVYYPGEDSGYTEARPQFIKDLQSGEYIFWFMSVTPVKNVEPQPPEYFGPQGLRKRSKR